MPTGVYIRKNKKTLEEIKIYKRKYWIRYYLNNKNSLLEKNRIRRDSNKEYYKKYEKNRYAKNPDFYRNKWLKYCKENREKINKHRRERYKNDINYKISSILRSRFLCSIKKYKKKQSAILLLGCSFEYFKIYLESRFKDGMTWDNWSYKGWHIDHIKPVSLFNLNNQKEVAKAWHYTNLQPMWSMENHIKGNRITSVDNSLAQPSDLR